MRCFFSLFVMTLLTTTLSADASKAFTVRKDPAAPGQPFKKVAVIVLTGDPPARKTAENMFAAKATPGTQIVAAHTFLTDEQLKEKDAVIAGVKANGFDALAVFRAMVSREEVESTTRAVEADKVGGVTFYGDFGAYWSYYGPSTFRPLMTAETKIVQVESLLFSVEAGKLVWSALQKLKSPQATFSTLQGVIDKTSSAMKKDNLIQ